MYKRNCPLCFVEITYKSKDSLNIANDKNSSCRKCGYKKQSEVKKGQIFSDDHKKNLSESHKGKKLSKEHKDKIGLSCKGKVRSDESKKRYSDSKIGGKNPAKKPEVREKIRNSILKLYEDNPEIKDKISKSVNNYFQINNIFISEDEKSEYIRYRKLIDNLTKRNKKKLIEEWNGLDYYDGEDIKINFNLNYNDERYPTIDHKISIFEGFKKGYQVEEISSLDNLCITKRKNNTKKSFKNEEEFKLILGQ